MAEMPAKGRVHTMEYILVVENGFSTGENKYFPNLDLAERWGALPPSICQKGVHHSRHISSALVLMLTNIYLSQNMGGGVQSKHTYMESYWTHLPGLFLACTPFDRYRRECNSFRPLPNTSSLPIQGLPTRVPQIKYSGTPPLPCLAS